MTPITSFIMGKALPLVLSIIGFGLLIVVHELGHFLFCKLFNIYTPSFSIGLGPKIFERKIGETTFRLAQIPFGGYVEIAGQQEMGQGEQGSAHDTSDRSFNQKYYWQKLLVLCGGIMFNLIFAYMTFVCLFFVGSSGGQHGPRISGLVPLAAADRGGLIENDEITAINGVNLTKDSEETGRLQQDILLEIIQKNPLATVSLEVSRKETKKTLRIRLDKKENTNIGSLGVYFAPSIQKQPFINAIRMGIYTTNTWIFAIAHSLVQLFKKKSLDGAGGPVMIFAQGFKTAQQGFLSLFIFLAIMSINLALFNLLPLGITDGGQILCSTIEFITRRPLPNSFRTGLNIVSLILFVILAAYLTYKDIGALCGTGLTKIYTSLRALCGR